MMKLFKRILDFFNIHPDKNQRWTLSTVFVVGLLYTYVQPAITKAWVSELPAEWIAFQSLAYSICGLLIGMIWKGWVRRKAIQWFSIAMAAAVYQLRSSQADPLSQCLRHQPKPVRCSVDGIWTAGFRLLMILRRW